MSEKLLGSDYVVKIDLEDPDKHDKKYRGTDVTFEVSENVGKEIDESFSINFEGVIERIEKKPCRLL